MGQAPDTASARRISVMGVELDNLTRQEALPAILELVRRDRPSRVNFVNAHCVNVAIANPWYRLVLNSSDLILPDGIGLRIAGRLHGQRIRDNVNGTDLFPELCGLALREGLRMYLLGGRDGVASEAAREMRARYPGLGIIGASAGYFRRKADRDEEEVLSEIRAARPDLLLVGFGVPRQELWAEQNLDRIGAKVVLGVGGLFDYYSGEVRRAPAWIRSIGMEWSWRFAQEPTRLFQRYVVGNPVFISRAVKAKVCGDTTESLSALELQQ